MFDDDMTETDISAEIRRQSRNRGQAFRKRFVVEMHRYRRERLAAGIPDLTHPLDGTGAICPVKASAPWLPLAYVAS